MTLRLPMLVLPVTYRRSYLTKRIERENIFKRLLKQVAPDKWRELGPGRPPMDYYGALLEHQPQRLHHLRA